MIRDLLVAKIKDRFPNRPFSQGTPPEAIVIFPAAHDEVGALSVYDDGNEARVEIAKITHGHFGCWDEGLSQTEREMDIAESVVDFVDQVFNEKVIFFLRTDGRVGGWQMLKPDGTRHEKKPEMSYYSWAGPLAD